MPSAPGFRLGQDELTIPLEMSVIPTPKAGWRTGASSPINGGLHGKIHEKLGGSGPTTSSEAGGQGCHCLIVAGAAAVCQSLQGNAAGAFRGMDGVDLRTSEKGNPQVVSSNVFNNQG